MLEHISLGGLIEGPGGPEEDTSGGFAHGGWIRPYADPALGAVLQKRKSVSVDLFLGRKTCATRTPYWPEQRP